MDEKSQLKVEVGRLQDDLRALKLKHQTELNERLLEQQKKYLAQIQEQKDKQREQLDSRDVEIEYKDKRIRELERENKRLRDRGSRGSEESPVRASHTEASSGNARGRAAHEDIQLELLQMKKEFEKRRDYFQDTERSAKSKKSARSTRSSKSQRSSKSRSKSRKGAAAAAPAKGKKVRINLKQLQNQSRLRANSELVTDEDTLKPSLKRPPKSRNNSNKFDSNESFKQKSSHHSKYNSTSSKQMLRPRSQTSTRKSWL